MNRRFWCRSMHQDRRFFMIIMNNKGYVGQETNDINEN